MISVGEAFNGISQSSVQEAGCEKTTGLGLGTVIGTSGLVSARGKQRRDRLLEASHEILTNTGSVEKQHEFLRNHGFKTAKASYSYDVPHGDGVSTQSFSDNDLDITISLYVDCYGDGSYTAELSWYYRFDSADNDYGYIPPDIAGIGWEEGYWDYESYDAKESTYGGGDITVGYRDNTSGAGPGFNVADVEAPTDGWGYCGVHMVPLGDYSSDERILQGGYSHTWNDVGIDSVSVAYPFGVSVTAKDETYEWATDTEMDGSTLLRINQSQAVC